MNSTTNDGEKMEKQMWEDIKAKNWKAVESKIAEGFQSVHPDGARDRASEISLIKNLNIGRLEFNDFRSKPTPRLSVWKKGTGGWQWICHANLNPIP
ncbi:MAG: hypothetical protein DME94_11740 [Verrucomicrobia bacterium]|nr:MAG: hypothetical protein DME94_11740 [Verrucomicrobiota bacterium]